MHRFFFALLSLALFIACESSQKSVAPSQTADASAEQDDDRQVADIRGPAALTPEQMQTLRDALAAAKITDLHNEGVKAWLEPDPYLDYRYKDFSVMEKWHTYEVKTRPGADIDSLYVLVNVLTPWLNPIIEVAGGANPPSRNYCPAEVNDHPTRARRPGWNVHLQICDEGLRSEYRTAKYFLGEDATGEIPVREGYSEYLLYGFTDTGKLEIYTLGFIGPIFYDVEKFGAPERD